MFSVTALNLLFSSGYVQPRSFPVPLSTQLTIQGADEISSTGKIGLEDSL
jgi:hypothetical protein